MNVSKLRQSNFELLRIISMMLIVMSHCDEIFGLSELYSTALGIKKVITDFLHVGGQIGVGCFVLISGYFMIEQRISLKKILKILGEVWIYSIGIWLAYSIWEICGGKLSFLECIKEAKYAFFPILNSHYWFATAYIILMILSPFLNKLIITMDKREYFGLLISLLIIFVVLQGGFPNIIPGMSEGRLIPVFIMYFIAGYVKRFFVPVGSNARKHFIAAIVLFTILLGSFYFITYIGIKTDSENILAYRYFYRSLNSPIVVWLCIELFIGFIEISISYNRIINEVGGCTFGVYLIHENRWIKQFLPIVFPIFKFENPLWIFICSIVSALVIFFICVFVDYIRKKTIELWINHFLDRNIDALERFISKVCKCLFEFLNGVLHKIYAKDDNSGQ